jgi:S-DNA-T family DNA segregation ATPase FtsK/SpoIIIE
MAKRKKQTRRKTTRKKKNEAPMPSNFWPIVGAILMFLLAFFLLLGSFNTGGPLPVAIFDGAYWIFGNVAYLTSVGLVCFGVWKFKNESHKIPLQEFVSVIGFLIVLASWLHVTFSSRSSSAQTDSAGGEVGRLFGDVTLGALDMAPASVLFAVLSFLLLLLSFRISPKTVFDAIGNMFTNESRSKDTDLASLKQQASDKSFKVDEGVPVERSSDKKENAPRLSTMKNTAQQLSTSENHEALTIASDLDWKFPSLSLLNQKQDKADAGNVEGNAKFIKETLANFNIDVEMEGANIGPRVTQYTLKPPTGVKLTKLTALENNLALDLAATSIRIEAPIPGKRLVGIEVPNIKYSTVRVSSILQSKQWKEMKEALGFAIGKDISGIPIAADLAKMPHLLVAGQTGSGKSVMINTILTSLVYRNSPADLKLILVDPKFVELKTYNDIPHLLTPVITEPEKCISALKWAVAEMERRLRAMSEVNASNITEYNEVKEDAGMPYIVIVIDELSDLMMMAARDVEALIVRLAQKSRAAGIHLVLATQRPSVNVITGLIKANIPARIAFTVNSHVDSKTILDQGGAEKLLGMGDMLYTTSDMPKPRRAQGALINKDEIIKITDYLREQRKPQYDDEVVSQVVQLNGKGGIVVDYGANEPDDDMYKDAVRAVIDAGKASTSMLQRKLRVGYGRAARMVETMEEQGIVGPADGSRPRDVLVSSMDDVFNNQAAAQASEDKDVYDDMPDEK